MRLAIADPPYPPFTGSGGRKNRASRWYGDGQRSAKDHRDVADRHPEAARWDDPAEHRRLLERLVADFDGWAIATSPDGLAAYHPLPAECRIMAWIRPNSPPGAHRILNRWEAVVVYPPAGRRSNRQVGGVPDVLTCPAPRVGFTGAKPAEWVLWVLEALSYTDGDELVDLFPGSGAVEGALAQLRLDLEA
ncbi:MAG: hypothetical protein ACF8PN_05065 [Phycisphaerales bacterium]